MVTGKLPYPIGDENAIAIAIRHEKLIFPHSMDLEVLQLVKKLRP
jgi:hypothetical protein